MNKITTNYIQQYQQTRELIKSNISSFLSQSKDIDELYNKIEVYFQGINDDFRHIKDFEIGLISTKSVVEPWYYDSKYYSEKAIEITQNKQKKYIWINDGQWESYNYDNNNQLAEFLSGWVCFDFPHNIKAMTSLIKEGYWRLCLELPILSEKSLVDTDEVYSWDDNYVLSGTSINNIERITIKHWNRIIENEKSF